MIKIESRGSAKGWLLNDAESLIDYLSQPLSTRFLPPSSGVGVIVVLAIHVGTVSRNKILVRVEGQLTDNSSEFFFFLPLERVSFHRERNSSVDEIRYKRSTNGSRTLAAFYRGTLGESCSLPSFFPFIGGTASRYVTWLITA